MVAPFCVGAGSRLFRIYISEKDCGGIGDAGHMAEYCGVVHVGYLLSGLISGKKKPRSVWPRGLEIIVFQSKIFCMTSLNTDILYGF